MKTRTIVVLISVLVAFCIAGTASAAEWVSSGPTRQSAAAVEEYWTVERMQDAKPAPMGISGHPTDVSAANLEAAGSGTPGAAAGSRNGRVSVLLSAAEATEASAIEPASATYPFPHTTYKVLRANYKTYPYRAIGKVFFTKATGGNYVCSGSSIGGRAVLTAGHCVCEAKGTWHTNWSFVPAYRGWYTTTSYIRPYGTWTSYIKATFVAWKTYGSWCRDVGIVVTNNVSGKKLSQAVGYLGFAWNWNRSKLHWDAFGYPSQYNSARYPWDGKEMVHTGAEWARNDNPGCTPYTVGIGTAQRPGSSGGPWIVYFWPNRSGAYNYANGVFSYYYTSQPDGIYSPYFDTTVYNFRTTYIAK